MYYLDYKGQLSAGITLPPPPITNSNDLIMYTIYQAKPSDRPPATYLMKQYYILPGRVVWRGWQRWYYNLDNLTEMMTRLGFISLGRGHGDKPEVVISFI